MRLAVLWGSLRNNCSWSVSIHNNDCVHHASANNSFTADSSEKVAASYNVEERQHILIAATVTATPVRRIWHPAHGDRPRAEITASCISNCRAESSIQMPTSLRRRRRVRGETGWTDGQRTDHWMLSAWSLLSGCCRRADTSAANIHRFSGGDDGWRWRITRRGTQRSREKHGVDSHHTETIRC